MKFLVPIFVTVTSIFISVNGYIDNSFHIPNDIPSRRIDVSYSSNIIHEQNPNNPDQVAQSTVNVDFKPSVKDDQPGILQYGNTAQEYSQNAPSQSYNVGYSVSFKNTPQQPTLKPKIQPRYNFKSNLDEGEIITGTRKQNERVDIPNGNQSPQDFVSNAFLEKKHKASSIKPKLRYSSDFAFPNPKIILTQASLSPTVQKHLKVIEEAKPLYLSNQEAKQLHQPKYTWTNLSPSVQIIKSTEIPVNNKASFGQQSSLFNHADALQKSESFDYTNAVDSSGVSPTQPLQPINKFGTNFYSSLVNPNNEKQTESFLPPISRTIPGKLTLASEVPQVFISSASDQTLQTFQKTLPQLPVDTTLLRDPVITTDFKNVASNPSLLPIHFDVTPIQQAMKGHLQVPVSSPYQFNGATPVQNNGLYQSSNSQVQHTHLPGLANLNIQPYSAPTDNHQQTQESPAEQVGFQDFQLLQNKHQYKIYGKPQPVKNLKVTPDHSPRQPRYTPNEYLQTNLRPPLFLHHPQRRIYIGY